MVAGDPVVAAQLIGEVVAPCSSAHMDKLGSEECPVRLLERLFNCGYLQQHLVWWRAVLEACGCSPSILRSGAACCLPVSWHGACTSAAQLHAFVLCPSLLSSGVLMAARRCACRARATGACCPAATPSATPASRSSSRPRYLRTHITHAIANCKAAAAK